MAKRKRPSPLDGGAKGGGKKGRIGRADPITDSGGEGVITPSASASASTAGEVVSGIAGSRSSPNHAAPAAEPLLSVKSTSRSGSAGNRFLKLFRGEGGGGSADQTSNEEAEETATLVASVKNESRPVRAPSNGLVTPTPKDPRVPFPHLPLEHETDSRYARFPLVVLLLFLLSMCTLIYIGYQQTRHNLIQLQCDLEVNSLKEELAASQDEVNILQDRMMKLEQAKEAREMLLSDDKEVFNGLFGPMVGWGKGRLLGADDRNQWSELLRGLEVDKESTKNEFNENLTLFGVQ